MDMTKAINHAAENLPDGYRIEIMIENGGYGVELIVPNEKARAMDQGSLGDDVIIATDRAVAHYMGLFID